jgi:hypothetical protein
MSKPKISTEAIKATVAAQREAKHAAGVQAMAAVHAASKR